MFSSGHQWQLNGPLGFGNNDSSFLLLLVFLTGSKPSYFFLRNCGVFFLFCNKNFPHLGQKATTNIYTLVSNSRANTQDKIVEVIMCVKPSKLSSSEDSTQSLCNSMPVPYSQQAAKTVSSYKTKQRFKTRCVLSHTIGGTLCSVTVQE